MMDRMLLEILIEQYGSRLPRFAVRPDFIKNENVFQIVRLTPNIFIGLTVILVFLPALCF